MSVKIGLENWHHFVTTKNTDGLDSFIDDDAVLYSPVVFKPIEGKFMVTMYLMAAAEIIANNNFKYERELTDETGAVLEFSTEINEISVEGVDMLKFTDEGKLKEIKVMVRPLKAVNMVHQKMGEYLQKMNN
ncbi:hypothetical protein OD91_1377 [Lutibacter sp. Hel_I_33_5]|uniref:nuclear transport factor 2 family protein n=1 Tax=Lutibacter sp. Hel_I_33_5 TaxID=1566289 RepID=UPI0011A23F50|nr:nuclear transport factor 2 family protein [Lutibacter sp. Hel_I_33_5]TVZ56098.1 hypothetical protein OD91_1377 [Lutibacter sp. Hel_I_33_5]